MHKNFVLTNMDLIVDTKIRPFTMTGNNSLILFYYSQTILLLTTLDHTKWFLYTEMHPKGHSPSLMKKRGSRTSKKITAFLFNTICK